MCYENKIKQLRLERSWSQEQLAEITSLNVKTIQRIENGAEPSLETLSAIAAAFDVKVKDLTQEKEYKKAKIAEEKIENAKFQIEQESRFYKKIIIFFIISFLLIGINVVTRSNHYWFIYPVITMLAFLIVSWLKVFIFKNKIKNWKKNKLQRMLQIDNE